SGQRVSAAAEVHDRQAGAFASRLKHQIVEGGVVARRLSDGDGLEEKCRHERAPRHGERYSRPSDHPKAKLNWRSTHITRRTKLKTLARTSRARELQRGQGLA